MKIYFSAPNLSILQEYHERTGGRKLNILVSYYEHKTNLLQTLEKYAPYIGDVMLDSGAFSMFKEGVGSDAIKDLMRQFHGFLKSTDSKFLDRFKMIFNLDYHPDKKTGLAYNQQAFHDLQQAYSRVVPVLHDITESSEDFETYSSYNPCAIAIGTSEDKRKLKYLRPMVDRIHASGKPCHILGVTSLSILKECYVSSCDSKSWLDYSKSGQVMYVANVEHDIIENIYFPNKEDDKRSGTIFIHKYNGIDNFCREMKKELQLELEDFFHPVKCSMARGLANIYGFLKIEEIVNLKYKQSVPE